MRNIYRIFGLGLALLLGAPALSASVDPGERIDRFLKGLDSLEARFVQTVETEKGVTGPLQGTFYLLRPGRFRWDYDGENSQLIVADGKRVWLLDRELEQVSHQSQTDALRGTPAQLLAADEPVEQWFTVADGGEFDGQTWVEMVPRDEESQFAVVRLGFAGNELSRLEMSDKFGQYTRFAFADVKRNPPLDAALFKFEPPPGWDVFQTH